MRRPTNNSRGSSSLAQWPLLAGVALGFLGCTVGGHVLARVNCLRGFTRFHSVLDWQTLYYPTVSQVRSLAREVLRPDRVTVVLGGNSIMCGLGQGAKGNWAIRLQELLGDDFQVLNLAQPGAWPFEFGATAAEVLLRDHPRLIFVTNTWPGLTTPLGEPDGQRMRYFYWQAQARGLLAEHPERDAALRRLEGERDETFRELRRQCCLDSRLAFHDLWNAVAYRWANTVWCHPLRSSWTRPRRNYPDLDPEIPPAEERRLKTVRWLFPLIRSNAALAPLFVPPPGAGKSWHEPDSPLPRGVRECLPPVLRGRTLVLLNHYCPYYLRELTPQERQRHYLAFAVTARLIARAGVHAAEVGRSLPQRCYFDHAHPTAEGGRRLAEEVAPKIRALARELGYIAHQGSARTAEPANSAGFSCMHRRNAADVVARCCSESRPYLGIRNTLAELRRELRMTLPGDNALPDRWVAPRPLLAGVVLSFLGCCLGGRALARVNCLRHFTRFHVVLNSQTLYYPTVSQVRSLARNTLRPEKVAVVLGGNSILMGFGQGAKGNWAIHLQELLGDDFQVLNLALPNAYAFEFGSTAAEVLLRDHPRLILVTNTWPEPLTAPGEPDGRPRMRYFYWQAQARELLREHPDREAALRRLEATRDEAFRELRRQCALDANLSFHDLWNAVAYRWVNTVWSCCYSVNVLWTSPRRIHPDWDLCLPPAAKGQLEASTVQDRGYLEKRAAEGRLFFPPPGKNKGWREPESPLPRSARECLPAALRGRTLVLLNRLCPYCLRVGTPQEREDYRLAFAATVRLFARAGIRATEVGRDLPRQCYSDRIHLTAEGGRRLAEEVAPKIRALARELGYIDRQGSANSARLICGPSRKEN